MEGYKFNKYTKEYEGIEKLYIDPEYTKLSGRLQYLIPDNITFKAPNSTKFKTPIYDKNNNKWNYVNDYRGTPLYNKSTKEIKFIDKINEIPDFNIYTLKTPKIYHVWDEDINDWKYKEELKYNHYLDIVREKREVFLKELDSYLLPLRWNSYTSIEKRKIKQYRLELLNITEKVKNKEINDLNGLIFPKLNLNPTTLIEKIVHNIEKRFK